MTLVTGEMWIARKRERLHFEVVSTMAKQAPFRRLASSWRMSSVSRSWPRTATAVGFDCGRNGLIRLADRRR